MRKINFKIKRKHFIILACVLVLIIGFSLFQINLSGNVVLELDAEYHEGENLDGILKLSLSNGEFIPASSKVVFEVSGQRQEFVLGEIIVDEPVEGEYYIQGKDVSGSGLGYGLIGVKEVYPELSFVFNVYSESEEVVEEETESPASDDPIDLETETESPASGEVVGPEITEEVNETEPVEEVEETGEVVEEVPIIEEEAGEETPVVEEEEAEEKDDEEVSVIKEAASAISMSFSSLLGLSPTTGQVTLNLETDVSGKVSREESFVYNLEEGQTAELLSGSVMNGLVELSDDVMKFEIVDDKVIISTDYSEMEEGYGLDYLGDEFRVFYINLSAIDLSFDKGDLDISFVYNEEQIISLSAVLQEGETEGINESELLEVPEFSLANLTEEERNILIGRFGDVPVRTTISEVIDDRLVRNYKIGDYELVASYDYDLGITDSLKGQMEKDKINFLRDIIKMISEENIASEDVGEFLVGSSF